uniref:Uncharacterized protein n=1 Tax=Ciona intestinalis TaxID=7719 RepID=F6ZVU9_CIOIN
MGSLTRWTLLPHIQVVISDTIPFSNSIIRTIFFSTLLAPSSSLPSIILLLIICNLSGRLLTSRMRLSMIAVQRTPKGEKIAPKSQILPTRILSLILKIFLWIRMRENTRRHL